ncbi:hypothetical protein NDU88_000573 [Pleurodeles waltl]|uniref:Uncharacterized protein n=1 Tax=Pleurodeles waltl TaxID=8319 RepID=A0AAV7KQ93_PLEWA|nr:hypothetical protein NDU88_000573 [Pleurodeles waltl]
MIIAIVSTQEVDLQDLVKKVLEVLLPEERRQQKQFPTPCDTRRFRQQLSDGQQGRCQSQQQLTVAVDARLAHTDVSILAKAYCSGGPPSRAHQFQCLLSFRQRLVHTRQTGRLQKTANKCSCSRHEVNGDRALVQSRYLCAPGKY